MNKAVQPKDANAKPLFDDIRRRFPATENLTYMNIGSHGIISDAARAAAVAAVDGHWSTETDKDALASVLSDCRRLFAGLIGGQATEVAVTKNVSEGLNAIALAMDWTEGDNVVLCTELEHPNNVYLWHALTRFGVELRSVASRGGEIDAHAIAEAIDERTRIVTASSVTCAPGFRTDLATIGRAARARGTLFLVDGVQSCGVLGLDVNEGNIDALAVATSKGLLGVAGVGLLWVRKDWLPHLRPAYVARKSVDTQSAHHVDTADFDYAPTAARFEIGNYNHVGLAAAAASLKEIDAVGIALIEDHALRLAERLRSGFEALDYVVQRPADPAGLSHLVAVGERSDADTTTDPRLRALTRAFDESDVRYAIRRGVIRLGVHMYNNDADLDKTLAIAATV